MLWGRSPFLIFTSSYTLQYKYITIIVLYSLFTATIFMHSDDEIQNMQHYSRIQSFISVVMECVGRAKREDVTFSGTDPNYGMVTWIFANIARYYVSLRMCICWNVVLLSGFTLTNVGTPSRTVVSGLTAILRSQTLNLVSHPGPSSCEGTALTPAPPC